jgi:DNA mismatch repair protein MutS
MSDDITPIRQQYLEIKRQYPDSILLFRLGDFYETFDQDAETTARELDIVLTSRPIGKGLRAPLAGIPYHAIDNYLSRLIQKGYHVAICEQVGETPTKGLFERKVVRVVTPGTIGDPDMLPDHANNYLAAVVIDGDHAGIAYVDITTGEFAATELAMVSESFSVQDVQTPASIRSELARLHPAEILHPDNQILPNGLSGHLTAWPAWRFEPGRSQETLLNHFGTTSLEGFGLKGLPIVVRAAAGIIQYLKETDSAALTLLTGLRIYSQQEFMTLDASTRRNLELTETIRAGTSQSGFGNIEGSLLGILDRTITPMGKRLIRQWISQPLLNIEKIVQRQNGIEYFFSNSLLRAEFRSAIKPIADIERLTNRVISGHAQPRDIVALRDCLQILPVIQDVFTRNRLDGTRPGYQNVFAIQYLDPCNEALSLMQSALGDDPPQTLQNIGVIRDGFSEELDSVIEASRHAREWINNLESIERERTGIKTVKVGYNKVFGYYIEVSQGQAGNVPQNYIRKQTLVNAERFITPELKEYETLVVNAEEHIREIELRVFREILVELSKFAHRILESARSLAVLDVSSSLAEVAVIGGYVRPIVVDENVLEITEGRHPVVENSLHGEKFIPNDISFEKGEVVRIITGPNMSGKSTYLRQAALITLMAQMGSFVPAASAKIGLVDRIFTRIGAQDEIHAGQSTFMVEMIEAANILHHATARSLLILDEIGRGTSTYDGVSIAWAVVEYIHNHPNLRAKTLFATHYHELTQLAELLPGVRNYNVAVTEVDKKVVFLHKIVPGGADRSYGIHVAQLAGLPRPVTQRASEIMSELEKSSGKAVRIDQHAAQQVALFPETNPLLDELEELDINSLAPIEALNILFEWQRKYRRKD